MIINDDGPMTEEEYLRIQQKVCGQKARHGARHAREEAARLRDRDGVPYAAYKCPFGSPNRREAHWHVGHSPQTMIGIERLALALRYKSTRPS